MSRAKAKIAILHDMQSRYSDVILTKKDAYIAGAHSRDEEVEGLKKKLEDITILKNFFASSLDIYDKDNKQLQDELNLLRNPWKSVEDMLPKEGQPLVVVNKSGNRYYCYYNASIEEFVTIDPDGNSWNVCDVSHWMLIPELKKGE